MRMTRGAIRFAVDCGIWVELYACLKTKSRIVAFNAPL